MKPILIIWAFVCACLAVIPGNSQTRCDTAIVGVQVNLSLGSNCHLNILPKMVVGNFDTVSKYVLTVFDEEGDTIDMPITEKYLDVKLTVEIQDTTCTDGMGNVTRFATSIVYLEDYLPPIITCVSDTMTCVEYFFNKPDSSIIDCQPFTVDILEQTFDTLCNDSLSARVTRTFRATDASGNSSVCTEDIVLKRFDIFNEVDFPDNVTISCEVMYLFTNPDGSLKKPPSELPTNSGSRLEMYPLDVPVTSSGSIPLHGLNFKACNVRAFCKDRDPIITPCKTVYMREWSVYEWHCNDELKTTSMQIISVVDTTPPHLVFNQDTFFQYIDGSSCMSSFQVPQPDTLDDFCQTIIEPGVIIENSHGPLIHSLMDSVRDVGVDTLTLVYKVNDGCHNLAVDTITVIISDTISPIALCQPSPTIVLEDSIKTTVPISIFNNGSYDNCDSVSITAARLDEGIFRDSLCFTCADTLPVTVKLRVIDEYGNISTCNSIVTVDTSMVNCPTSGSAVSNVTSLSGVITYEDGIRFAESAIQLSGDISSTIYSDNRGRYETHDLLSGQRIQVMPVRDDNHPMGVTTLDIIYMQRHILGLEQLNSPYQIIAGDANGNGRLNAADLYETRKLVLSIIDEFPKTTSFVFIPSDLQFEDPLDPWLNGNIYGEDIKLQPGNNIADFMGIKIGDVNRSILKSDTRSSKDEVIWKYKTLSFGNLYEVSLLTENELIMDGFQTTLKFNPDELRFVKIQKGQISIKNEHVFDERADEGLVNISWNDVLETEIAENKDIFRVQFERISSDKNPKVEFTSTPIESEIYIDKSPNHLRLYDANESQPYEFDQVSIVPNPWSNETNLNFDLPKSGTVKLNIYDATMKRIWSHNAFYESGTNAISISSNELSGEGVFLYELIFEDQIRAGKMTRHN